MADYNDDLMHAVHAILKRHRGPDDCISMDAIFQAITHEHIIPRRRYDQTRMIRGIVRRLRERGCPIGIKPTIGGGYFWAENPEQLEATINVFHGRGLSSLRQEAALKQCSFNELLRQYELELSNQPQELST